MFRTVTLHGYRFSVYNRIVRMVLHEKTIPHFQVEVDPFSADTPNSYRDLHPFGKVPVLSHGGFTLYETGAITRYLDAAFEGPCLTPAMPEALGRMAQAIAIMDSYGYWPMIRQAFAHRIFRPLAGQPAEETEVAAGVAAATRVLAALEPIASERQVLDGRSITLADCHLAPMFAYFLRVEEGRAALARFPALSGWWDQLSRLESLLATDPGLPGESARP